MSDYHKNEQRINWVVLLTALTMGGELVAGYWTGSMALIADGWHMASHVGALLIAAGAYQLVRRHLTNSRFQNGPKGILVLSAYTNALFLGVMSLWISIESVHRLLSPVPIHFEAALTVACIGLVINLASAALLHKHDHHDHNMNAAYFHVLADALTSIFAIFALAVGWQMGWNWLDPVLGFVSALIILRWSWQLGIKSGKELVGYQ